MLPPINSVWRHIGSGDSYRITGHYDDETVSLHNVTRDQPADQRFNWSGTYEAGDWTIDLRVGRWEKVR